MNISPVTTITQIANFLKASSDLDLKPNSKQKTYEWLQKLLLDICYRKLKKKDKKMVKMYIKKVTGYLDVHIKRLLKKYRGGTLKWTKWQLSSFASVYDENDIGLLHDVDCIHRLSGPATQKILEREFSVFKKMSTKKFLKFLLPTFIIFVRK